MKFFQNMSPQAKSTLLKMTGLLALVIIIFTVLSRTSIFSGETLSEYAEKNPELALGSNETAVSPENATPPANNTVENTSGTNDGTDSNTTNTDISDNTTTPTDETGHIEESLTPEPVSPERVTYKEDFYYEPLSEELIAYITGVSYPAEGAEEISYEDLSYVHILHVDFDGNTAEGELICNDAIAQDFVEIFYELYVAEYQIEKVTLIENYDGDDTASMLDNNTSCFNFRPVEGTGNLSKHAYGLAIDINPFYNPYITYTDDGEQRISPEGSEPYADRSQSFPYKIDSSDLCYQLFIEHGFIWGGNWNSCKDYQHFQKVID